MKFYRGKFRPKNISKYSGDYTNIVYRSMWERQVLKFLDENDNVVSYNSEEVVIPYRCPTDNNVHRYFIDLKITFRNGKTFLVEIKPKAQTKEPKKRSRNSKKYITEVMTYVKNVAKWTAATAYCEARGWEFEVWTEDHIQSLGIKLLT